MFLLGTLLAFATIQDAAPAPLLTISPPNVAAKSGAVVPIGVYFRNGGTEPLDVVVPERIDAEIVTPNARSAAELVRTAAAIVDKRLAPGEIHFVEYTLDLPDEISGRVVVQLVRLGAAPAVIDIEEPATTDEAQADAVQAPGDSPVDPSAAPEAPSPFRFTEAAWQRFRAHEPVFFLAGTDRPNVRYQFSFAYQFFNPEGPWASDVPFLSGLFLGYTQTSLWDLEGDSKPFTDTNYRPGIGWSKDSLDWLKLPGVAQTGFEFGVQHESNGSDADESRSINIAYVRPILHFGDPKGFEAQIAPKFYTYLPDREDNPDISDYRGYCDLRVTAGWANGFQAAGIGRLGKSGEHGSIQVDLTFPMRAIGNGNFDLYLQLQWFSGYGESLITYDEYTDALRIGIGFVR